MSENENENEKVSSDHIENDNDDQPADTIHVSTRDDIIASHTVASRQGLRDQLNADVEAFLARGGKISQVEPNVTADPPKLPDTNYGQRPI